MTIYVVTDTEGKILRAFNRLSDLFIACEDNFALGIQIEREKVGIRPITVTTTDGIVGKHWQDVDTHSQLLRHCELVCEGQGYATFSRRTWGVCLDGKDATMECDANEEAVHYLTGGLTHSTEKEA